MSPPIEFQGLARARSATAGEVAPGIVSPARSLIRARVIAACLVLAPTLMLLFLALSPPLNHDVAAILQFAERWVDGERLYVDLVDVNPPLVFLLSAPAAALAALLPIGAIAALQAQIILFAGFALSLCWKIERPNGGLDRPRAWILFAILPFLALGFAIEMFGQREHLLLVGMLPYLLLAERRAGGQAPSRGLVLPVAIVAGIVVCLKPHFMAVPGLVELYILALLGWRRWLRDAVPWTIAGLVLAYLILIAIAFPEYVSTVLPLVFDLYEQIGASALEVAFGKATLPFLLGVVFVAPLTLLGGHLPRMAALAAIGALASAIVQAKGWPYHVLPAEGFLLLTVAALVIEGTGRLLPLAAAARVAPVLAWLLVGAGSVSAIEIRESPWKQWEYKDSVTAELADAVFRYAHGAPVLVLSPGIAPIFPALNIAGSSLSLRFMNMWLVQGSNMFCPVHGRRYNEVWEMGRAEFYAFRAVAEDFSKNRPAVVVVDTDPGIPWCGSEFNYLEYFQRHPLFAEAFTHYRKATELGRYMVWVRED